MLTRVNNARKQKAQTVWLKANSDVDFAPIKCAVSDHFLIRAPVPIVFFYQRSISPQTIIQAIQYALQDYPLFAGRLQKQNDHFYIHCNNAGVKFTTHHHSGSIMQMINSLPSQPKTLLVDTLKSNNILKAQEPVLTIKLTSFACGGTSLGFCWNHCVGDMMSFMSFLKHVSNFVSGKERVLGEIADDRDAYLEHHLQNHLLRYSTKPSAGLTYLKNLDLMKLIFYILKHRKSKQGVNLYFTEDEIQTMKSDYESKANYTLSRNDVLCAHVMQVLSTLSSEARPNALSIIVNYRSRIGLPENLLGNFIGALKVPCGVDVVAETLACKIREGILHYHEGAFNYLSTREFIRQHGGVRSINRMMPTILLPNQKNLIVTSWCRFGIYDITFGGEKPLFVIPYGEAPLPWLSSVMPGLQGKGLLLSMILPKAVAREVICAKTLAGIHTYRSPQESLPAELLQCEWVV